jgi:hypothetical protein
MPKLLSARPPVDAVEERRIREPAGARHVPAGSGPAGEGHCMVLERDAGCRPSPKR